MSDWLDFGSDEARAEKRLAAEIAKASKGADAAKAADAARFAGRASSIPAEAAKATAVDPSTLIAEAEAARLAKAKEKALEESGAMLALAEKAKPYEAGAGGVPKGTAAEMVDAARFAGRAATADEYKDPDLEPQSAKGLAADALRLQARADAAGVSAPPAIVKGATELGAAKPSNVGAVLDKLKQEEAKGGPDFWDVIQAAAAGWGGQVPLYVQKEIARKEAESETQAMETAMQKEAAIRGEERASTQAFEREMAQAELANRLKLAGIATGGTGKLSLEEFMGAK